MKPPWPSTPIPWPPYAIAPSGTDPQPYVVMIAEGDLRGAWPLHAVTVEIVRQLARMERWNLKDLRSTPTTHELRQARENMRQARLTVFREGEALGEAGTTRDLAEQIAMGLWVIDQIYREVGAMARVWPTVAGEWPTRAALWRTVNEVLKGGPAWSRNEKKRAERIARLDARLKPESKPLLVATFIKHAIATASIER